MMNRVLILLLTLMTVGIPKLQAQIVTHDMLDRDAVQLKTKPIKTNQWASRSMFGLNGEIEDILWDFENGSADLWTSIDRDFDGYSWNVLEDAQYAHSGEVCVLSESYIVGVGALFPDNWLISPQVPLSGTLSLYAMNYLNYYPDSFAVYVCVSGDPDNFDNYVKISEDLSPNSSWTNYTFDLSQYGGQTGCIAIRHYNCADMYKLFIDDISITRAITPTPVITCEDNGYEVVVTATGEGYVCLYTDDQLVAEGEGYAIYSIPYGDVIEEYCFSATAQSEGKKISDYAVLTVEVPAIPIYQTPVPIITFDLTDFTMIITAVGEGTVTLYVKSFDDGNGDPTTMTSVGEGEVSIEIPRADEYRYFSVWASAIIDGWQPGLTSTQFIEVPPIEPVLTDPPVMYCEDTGEEIIVYVEGNGHICLYWDDMLVAEGENLIGYYIPYGEVEEEYCFSATAQGDGMLMSDYAVLTVVVPARPIPEIAPAPEIVVEVGDDFITISAYAVEGIVILLVNGEEVENPYVVERTDEDQIIEVTAFTVIDGYEPSELAYYEVFIPAKVQVKPGDADGDGEVTISDVTAIIDFILSNGTGSANLTGADVDNDGEITINDVTALIDYIINGTW